MVFLSGVGQIFDLGEIRSRQYAIIHQCYVIALHVGSAVFFLFKILNACAGQLSKMQLIPENNP